jgi:phenylpyruvate tautomerase PptA (4-oxalocrotonate tautomerase family)
MPMIDVYAPAGAFEDKHELARRLAGVLMTIEEVPDIAMFRQNTAAFIHELPVDSISNVDGASDYVRVQVMTNAGALDRKKQTAVVARFTELIANAPGKPPAPERIWVLLTEAPDGGWGLWGHAHTNADLIAAARRELAQALQTSPAGAGNDE